MSVDGADDDHSSIVAVYAQVGENYRQIDDLRTVGECFRLSGVDAASVEVATSFCRDMFRDLWRLGYLDLVFPSALTR